jgi:hypothetical protein
MMLSAQVMVSCSSDRIVLVVPVLSPSGPNHVSSMPRVWLMASANVCAAFFSLKLALVILRCTRQTAPSVVSTLWPNMLRMPYRATSLGKASRRCVIRWITSALWVYSMSLVGLASTKVSVPSRSKCVWPVL